MYKISFFFRYTFSGHRGTFYISDVNFSLDVSRDEKRALENFFHMFLLQKFTQDDFYNICDVPRKEILWKFFLSIKVILPDEIKNLVDTVLMARIPYNPSILCDIPSSSQIKQIYMDRFSIQENTHMVQSNGEIFRILKKRKTSRKYQCSKLCLEEVQYLCQCAYGNSFIEKTFIWIDCMHKTTPSGGGFFSSKIYFFAFGTNHIDVYIFDGEALRPYKHITDKQSFLSWVLLESVELDLERATGFILITADLQFSWKKYGAKSVPLALLEGWHISQNFVLACIEMWYGTCELWGIIEDNLLSFCAVKEYDIFVNVIVFGKCNYENAAWQ